MPQLHDNALAKINLFLHITGRREDGYHLLDSLAIFATIGDLLHLKETTKQHDTLSLSGPFSEDLTTDTDNLILRAARLLRETALKHEVSYSLPHTTFHLEKHLPIASGIGGGSADAASALRLLTRYWSLPKRYSEEVAPLLGADVPVCLAQRTTRMEGIGDILTPLSSLPPMGILLVNPGVAISTPSIFKRITQTNGIPSHSNISFPQNGWDTLSQLIEFLNNTTNDLQEHAIAQEPIINTVLESLKSLPNTLFARMSGSGATCFALYQTLGDAQNAAQSLQKKSPSLSWWIQAGSIK